MVKVGTALRMVDIFIWEVVEVVVVWFGCFVSEGGTVIACTGMDAAVAMVSRVEAVRNVRRSLWWNVDVAVVDSAVLRLVNDRSSNRSSSWSRRGESIGKSRLLVVVVHLVLLLLTGVVG